MSKLRVALVGLSFGLEFVPIYLLHPDVSSLVIVDINETLLNKVGEAYNIVLKDRLTNIQEALDDPTVDAIHLVTPPSTHAPLSVRSLNAGKHCGCTIPMGMSMDELYQVIEARRTSGKNYMFLETTVFQREYFYVRQMLESGALGRLQYMSCAHYQDMEGWPSYWNGFPPLMHPTHAIAPCLLLSGKLPKSVFARGSGQVRDELRQQYDCPFAFESALVELAESDVIIEMERFLYGVARSYSECFRVYGEDASYEWQQLLSEDPIVYTRTHKIQTVHGGARAALLDAAPRGGEILERRIMVPDFAGLLPSEIAPFTQKTVYDKGNKHLSFEQGGGHGGSHPHMVHEFVRSILENRPASLDDVLGAYMTGVGILAHQSAMKGGCVMEVPDFKAL